MHDPSEQTDSVADAEGVTNGRADFASLIGQGIANTILAVQISALFVGLGMLAVITEYDDNQTIGIS